METSIGLLELKSIPVGMEAADEMLKAADVNLLSATAACPGKYIIIISGKIGPVNSAVKAGIKTAGSFLLSQHTIHRVHEQLPEAILGLSDVSDVSSLGTIETISAVAAIRAGDIAAKASNVMLVEIRVARGLGGKGYLVFTGDISAVRSAVNACIAAMEQSGEICSHSVISSPHPQLVKQILQ